VCHRAALAYGFPVTVVDAPAVAPPPELGQLVVVRDRHWVVSEVVAASQPDDELVEPRASRQHLVELASVEDDAVEADAELSVIWEVEPAARVLETATLPVPTLGRFDDPGRLDAFLDAVRWGAVTSADSHALQSPFRSGITIEDYQLDPVVRALRMPRVNLLIADDVGLGKTIEAGLVAQELLLRHRARTMLIVCPASLTLKWQAEMDGRFGLEFRIVDAELLRELRRSRGVGTNPFRHFPRLICSIDWLKRPRGMGLIGDVLPPDASVYPRRFDLLIVDEVHQCAPAGRGRYARDSQRTEVIRAIAPHFEHRLFLSATPHNGYTESFTALLELLDPQRFARGIRPTEAQLAEVVVRRLKSQLRAELAPNPDGSPRFPARVIIPLEVDYPSDERQAHADLAAYTALRTRQATRPAARTATEFVTLLLKKRLFSSPAAFANTLALHMATLRRLARSTGAPRPTGTPGPTDAGPFHAGGPAGLRTAFERMEDDVDSDADLEEATEEALATAARYGEPATPEQWQLLESLAAWAEAGRGRADAKAQRLLDWLEQTCVEVDETGQRWWNDQRVIVFSEYRDTQVYLEQLMAARGLAGEGGERLALLYGGMDPVARERIKAEFQHHPSLRPLRILLATDAASEGIDLQRHCYRMVHVEIPFSPTRLEQRNGRIDRHGQPSPEVLIHHFVGAGWQAARDGSLDADLGFLLRVARKVETIRDDLGATGLVLAAQVEAKMLGRRANLDAEPPPRSAAAARVLNRIERDLRERIARLRAELDDSIEELGLTPQAVQRVVSTALALANQPPLRPATLVREAPPGQAEQIVPVFEVPALTRSWARAAADLVDPLSGDRLPVTFDNQVAAEAEDVVLAHLGHRLVAQSMRLLRSEIWSSASKGGLGRVTARVADVGELVVVAHARLVVTGADGRRLHEEVIWAGGRVAAGRFARYNLGQLRAALEAASDDPAPPRTHAQLVAAWPAVAEPLWAAVQARGGERAQSLARSLADSESAEVSSITQVLSELRRTIAAQLDELDRDTEHQLELALFSTDEREQYARDTDALRRRLEQIPSEIDRDTAAIARRYADPVPRVFPAAVSFLVPRALAYRGARAALERA